MRAGKEEGGLRSVARNRLIGGYPYAVVASMRSSHSGRSVGPMRLPNASNSPLFVNGESCFTGNYPRRTVLITSIRLTFESNHATGYRLVFSLDPSSSRSRSLARSLTFARRRAARVQHVRRAMKETRPPRPYCRIIALAMQQVWRAGRRPVFCELGIV